MEGYQVLNEAVERQRAGARQQAGRRSRRKVARFVPWDSRVVGRLLHLKKWGKSWIAVSS